MLRLQLKMFEETTVNFVFPSVRQPVGAGVITAPSYTVASYNYAVIQSSEQKQVTTYFSNITRVGA